MGLAYTFFLILYYCASIVLSIIVAKFVIFTVSGGGGGGEEERKLEKRLKVKALKSARKTVEGEISGETVLVSEYKGEPEPVVADDDSFDDTISKGLGSSADGSLEFPGKEATASEDACSADQLLLGGEEGGVFEASVIQVKDGCFSVNEGLICSSDDRVVEEEVGCCPIEGFELQHSNSRSDLVVYGEKLGSCVLNQQDDIGFFVGDADQELLNDVVLPSERGEVKLSEQDEGIKRSEPKHDDDIALGLLGGENGVDDDDQHKEHHMILESLETTDLKEGTQEEAYVGDQDKEIGSSVSMVTRDEQGRISDEEEEWEGIERNDLDRDFAKAANFVECNKEGQLNKLGSDVMIQFYGLQKVAMEGPCYEPPPMALKLFARAKWNAWQKLGSMNPEEAMENYINLLSEKVPGWMGSSVQGKISSEKDGPCSPSDANSSTTLTLPLTSRDESRPGEEPVMGAGNSSSVNTDVE